MKSSKVIYENGVSNDDEEIKKLIKKRKMKKYINPIITPYFQSIKDKNEYNIRLRQHPRRNTLL